MKNDYVKLVMKDLKDCELNMKVEEVANMKMKKYKEIVKKACKKAAFIKLLKEKDKLK